MHYLLSYHFLHLLKSLVLFYDILIYWSLRVGLFHEAKEVRAAVLRVLRYFLQESETVDLLYSLHIDYLIVRFVTFLL